MSPYVRSSPRLVRREHLDSHTPPAGRMHEHQFAHGLVPSFFYRSIGTHCADTTERIFSITYDDGPDPRTTPPILDVLARYGAVATFFVLAEPAQRHPSVIRRIVDEGHEVALHGYDHTSLLAMSTREAGNSILRARDIVAEISGQEIKYYRPPYGAYTVAQAHRIRRLGLDLTLWSGDAGDWVDDEAGAVVERAVARIFPGAVLLLHDTRADPETLGEGERLPTFDRAWILDQLLAATRTAGYSEAKAGDLLCRHPRVKTVIKERMRPA